MELLLGALAAARITCANETEVRQLVLGVGFGGGVGIGIGVEGEDLGRGKGRGVNDAAWQNGIDVKVKKEGKSRNVAVWQCGVGRDDGNGNGDWRKRGLVAEKSKETGRKRRNR